MGNFLSSPLTIPSAIPIGWSLGYPMPAEAEPGTGSLWAKEKTCPGVWGAKPPTSAETRRHPGINRVARSDLGITVHIMVTMNTEEVDERDSTWEQYDSIFRVYIAKGINRAITTFDVSDATFSEVLKWAKQMVSDDTIVAVALVGRDARGSKGLTWLFGTDPNSEPLSDIEFRMQAEMIYEIPKA
ncbi:hypothetical protein ACX80E_01720 [Arthrobacter sp. TMN-49]